MYELYRVDKFTGKVTMLLQCKDRDLLIMKAHGIINKAGKFGELVSIDTSDNSLVGIISMSYVHWYYYIRRIT